MYHPQKDEHGNAVKLHNPNQPSALTAWLDSSELACVVPNGSIVAAINGVPFESVRTLPNEAAQWEIHAQSMAIDEPPFDAPTGYKKSSGVVIREPDGRVWLVAPSNGFGGYTATFPKGRLDGKSPKAAALVEAFEESGLLVKLTAFLVDAPRSTTYTRYYLAERIGGNPADMGWESQAVMLAPVSKLSELLSSKYDKVILDALNKQLTSTKK